MICKRRSGEHLDIRSQQKGKKGQTNKRTKNRPDTYENRAKKQGQKKNKRRAEHTQRTRQKQTTEQNKKQPTAAAQEETS